MSKFLKIAGGILATGILITLLMWPKIKAEPFNTAGLECNPPNLPEIQHYHPHLTILIDGKSMVIPANIGLHSSCVLPLHTHEKDNIIHVESTVFRDFTLSQFMEIWGEPIVRDGYSLKMTVDNKPSDALGSLVLQDKQEIILEYTSNK